MTVYNNNETGMSSVGTGSGTILIVEDEELVMLSSKIMLEKCGYRVLTASDGNNALLRFRENIDAIDLVLIDLFMPGLSGEQVVEFMIMLKPGLRVIYASGYSMDEAWLNSAAEKGYFFIMKPYVISELSSLLNAALPANR